jgi:tetratricopeptide (TPR) repeat protein
LVIHLTWAQDDTLTDTDGLAYYSNPSSYIDKKVNFTGKVLALLPPSSGTFGLQMYHAGDTNRNTIVVYFTPLQFSKDECVRVIGVTKPVTEYQNMFGARLSAAAIEAGSIKKIDCSESIEPAIKTVIVNQTQEKSNVKITLHKIEFSNKNTRAFITVENTDPSNDITFNGYESRAIQEKTQFTTTTSLYVNYPNIESTIPAGIEENGVLLFEPLDPTKGEAQFSFEIAKGVDKLIFTFDVMLSSVEYYDEVLPHDLNNITALVYTGNYLYHTGKTSEAIRYYDKALSVVPKNKDEFDAIGTALYVLGNYTEANKYYDKALAIDPYNPLTLVNKANTLYVLAKYAEANKYYDKALAIDPNQTDVLIGKATVLRILDNYTGAIEFYDKALAIDPNQTDVLIEKGNSQHYIRNFNGAIESYDKALAIDPNENRALKGKADAIEDQKTSLRMGM